jgi:outer membrane protein assembly factor BamB
VATRVELVTAASSVSEAAGNAPVGVRVVTSHGGPLLCPVGVDYASADGTALAGVDYTAVSGRLGFAAGTRSGTVQTVRVSLVNDALDELDETFRLHLSNPAGAVLGLREHTVTILDDDPPPEVSVDDVSLAEGDARRVNALFTVSLSPPSGLEVRVDYATADGTAQAPSDYGARAGTLLFAPGTISHTVAVPVVGDTRYELDETFRVILSNPVNATLSDAEGIGRILNDDPQPPGVVFFTATSTSGRVKLEWLNPAEGPYLATLIRYRTAAEQAACSFPEGPAEGELLVSQPGSLGAHETFSHEGLLNDNTNYCYSAFVELEPGLFSRRRTSKGRPFDTSGAVKWAYSTGAASVEPPGVGPGAYAGSNDAILHGVGRGAAGGEWLSGWKHVPLGAPTQSRPPVVPTTLISGATQVVFVSSQDGHVQAVNAETGSALWRSGKLGEAVQAAVAAMFRGFGGAYDYLLVGTRNSSGANQFYALNPVDGTTVGTPFDNGGGADGIGIISGGASVDYAGKRVFFASRALPGGSANTVWCLDLTDTGLAVGWAVALADIDGSPILSNGRLYVGTNAGTVYALDPSDGGRVLWSFATGDGPVKGFIFADRRTDRLYFSTTTKVWGLTFGSSEPNWPPVELASPSTALFTPGGTLVLVGAGDGRLYQLDVANAGPGVPPEIRSVVLGDGQAGVGSPTLDVREVLVYVGSESGFIYAVEVPLQ